MVFNLIYICSISFMDPDFEMAFDLFLQEAESGNALAMYDLARMFTDGLGRPVDIQSAEEWYQRALASFLDAELSEDEKRRPYLQYRIGKMYAAGLGTQQDYGEAADWLSKVVLQNHKYAQYTLGKLYLAGEETEKDVQKAIAYFTQSSDGGNEYALGEALPLRSRDTEGYRKGKTVIGGSSGTGAQTR